MLYGTPKLVQRSLCSFYLGTLPLRSISPRSVFPLGTQQTTGKPNSCEKATSLCFADRLPMSVTLELFIPGPRHITQKQINKPSDDLSPHLLESL